MVRAAALGAITVAAGLMLSPVAAQQQQQGGFFDFFSNLLKGTPEEEAAYSQGAAGPRCTATLNGAR